MIMINIKNEQCFKIEKQNEPLNIHDAYFINLFYP